MFKRAILQCTPSLLARAVLRDFLENWLQEVPEWAVEAIADVAIYGEFDFDEVQFEEGKSYPAVSIACVWTFRGDLPGSKTFDTRYRFVFGPSWSFHLLAGAYRLTITHRQAPRGEEWKKFCSRLRRIAKLWPHEVKAGVVLNQPLTAEERKEIELLRGAGVTVLVEVEG